VTSQGDGELLLGKQTPPVHGYSPEILYAIPRATGRQSLALLGTEAIYGVDLWHAYEMSWLEESGRPVSRVGRFTVPSSSANIIESKSFKLYLNSLNGQTFLDDAAAINTITADVSVVAGAAVELELLPVDSPALAGAVLAGACVDTLDCEASTPAPDPTVLEFNHNSRKEARLYSHLLRSLCPVTGQPDWASVWMHYRGPTLEPESLLRYVLSFREHQEFHEQCVERMFCDIMARGAPEFLQVQAFYTRRGGLDINPMRSTDPASQSLPRLNRQ
jgi:7-cyano-7-deazaguanine reductase